jgi:hypothetical protein
MSRHALPVLRAGRVYRTRDLARWSQSSPVRLSNHRPPFAVQSELLAYAGALSLK